MKKYILECYGTYATFEYAQPFPYFSTSKDRNKATLYSLEEAEHIQKNWGHRPINIIDMEKEQNADNQR